MQDGRYSNEVRIDEKAVRGVGEAHEWNARRISEAQDESAR